MTQTVLSLSTIPPRFSVVGQTLHSLLNQSVRADRIELWIPRSYRRFPTHVFCLPDVPDGVALEVTDDDLGPATKVLPCARKYRGGGATSIVYCDDDRFYFRNWLKTMLAAAAQRPDEAIAGSGYDICEIDCAPPRDLPRVGPRPRRPRGGIKNLHRNLPYWIWRDSIRAMRALGIVKQRPPRNLVPSSSGYADIADGYGGVLVKPRFFDDIVYDIPPVLWAVDDYWLSGHLARKGIPIWVERNKYISGDHPDICPNSRLVGQRIDGHDRDEANQAAVDYFRKTYGVWQ